MGWDLNIEITDPEQYLKQLPTSGGRGQGGEGRVQGRGHKRQGQKNQL